jgi:hypothetical protein
MCEEGAPIGRIYGILKGHKRFFSPEDDAILRELKTNSPELPWAEISERMTGFTPRQLRERWCNYVSPTLKTSQWTESEDEILTRLYDEIGPRWGLIASHMGNRSVPDIKNRFQSMHNRSLPRRSKKYSRSRGPVQRVASLEDESEPVRDNQTCAQSARKDSDASLPEKRIDFSIKSILI